MADESPGVVLDRPLGEALLFQAVKEKLIDGDIALGNGYVSKLLANPPSADLLHRAFEQLVLCGRVFLPFWTPSAWEGCVFEDGLFVPLQSVEEESLVRVTDLAPEVVASLLQDRGVQWSTERLVSEYDKYVGAFDKAGEVLSPDELKVADVYMALLPLLGHGDRPLITERQAAAWERLAVATETFRPVISVIKEYRQVLTQSFANGLLSSVPVGAASLPHLKTALCDDTSERLTLLHFACGELGMLPIAAELRSTIVIAQSDAASEFRVRLRQWAELLKTAPDTAMKRIGSKLRWAKRFKSTGVLLNRGRQLLVGVSVPAALAGALTLNPIVTAAARVCALAGGAMLGGEKLIRASTRWASFGLKRP
ncbi:MAG: hypothetical protein ABFD77_03015 [Thermotogota bacterium]